MHICSATCLWASWLECVCVCVNSTSGGGRSLATPAYQGRLALVSLPLVGADFNKIKSATLTLPSAQGRPFPVFDNVGPTGPCAGRSKPLSFAKSKSIGRSHQNVRIGKPLLLTAPAQSSQISPFTMKFATVCLHTSMYWAIVCKPAAPSTSLEWASSPASGRTFAMRHKCGNPPIILRSL